MNGSQAAVRLWKGSRVMVSIWVKQTELGTSRFLKRGKKGPLLPSGELF